MRAAGPIGYCLGHSVVVCAKGPTSSARAFAGLDQTTCLLGRWSNDHEIRAQFTRLDRGAGPTGLVLAIWLARLGVAVRIIDKTAEPGTTSRALAISARTLELYQQLGMAGPLIEGGVKVPAGNFWVEGTRVARLPLGEMGAGLTPFPYALIFPQDAHEPVLVERLESMGVCVERRTELIGFDLHEQGVRATLRRADGAQETCEASYLAGCDGAHSIVRERLATGFPGGTYSDIFYVADVEGTGPATNGEIHVDLGRRDFLAVFPLKGTGRVRLVGTVIERPADARGELTFDDVRERVTGHLKFAIDRVNWFSTYRVHHRVASKFRDRRAFLLGDAAHVHSPVGGQGMNTGIGDAVNLAWKLAAVLNDGADLALLESYEPERIAFGAGSSRRPTARLPTSLTRARSPGACAPGFCR